MIVFRCLSLFRVMVICLSASAFAQEADKLTPLRTKDTLTDEDRVVVRDWVAERVRAIATSEGSAGQAAFTQLRDGLAGTSAKGFKEACVTATLESVTAAYKSAAAGPAAQLLTLVGLLNEPRSVNLLLEALQDNRTAVRGAAAVGLRNLRPKIAADADTYARVLPALVDAGKKEASRETLQLIYRALSFSDVPSPPNLKTDAAAVLELLEERVKQYAGSAVKAEGAETTGIQVAITLRPALDDAERRRFATILARALHQAVSRYALGEDKALGRVRDKTGGADQIALRNATEQIIKQSEQQLSEILALTPAPQVSEKMLKANLTDMVNEMNRWVGLLKDKLSLDLPVLNPPTESGGGEEEEP